MNLFILLLNLSGTLLPNCLASHSSSASPKAQQKILKPLLVIRCPGSTKKFCVVLQKEGDSWGFVEPSQFQKQEREQNIVIEDNFELKEKAEKLRENSGLGYVDLEKLLAHLKEPTVNPLELEKGFVKENQDSVKEVSINERKITLSENFRESLLSIKDGLKSDIEKAHLASIGLHKISPALAEKILKYGSNLEVPNFEENLKAFLKSLDIDKIPPNLAEEILKHVPRFEEKLKKIKKLQKEILEKKEEDSKLTSQPDYKEFLKDHLSKNNNTIDTGYTSLEKGVFQISKFKDFKEFFPNLSEKDTLVQFCEKVKGPYTLEISINYTDHLTKKVIEDIVTMLQKEGQFRIIILIQNSKKIEELEKIINQNPNIKERFNFKEGFEGTSKFIDQWEKYQKQIKKDIERIKKEIERIKKEIQERTQGIITHLSDFFFKNCLSNFECRKSLWESYQPSQLNKMGEQEGWIPQKDLKVKARFQEKFNFEKISQTKKNISSFSLDPQKLKPDYKKIWGKVRDGYTKEAIELLSKVTGIETRPVSFSKNSNEWKNVLNWILFHLSDPKGDLNLGKTAFAQIALAIFHCEDAQASVLNSLLLNTQGVKSNSIPDVLDFEIARLKEALFDERSKIFVPPSKPTMIRLLSKKIWNFLKKGYRKIPNEELTVFHIDAIAHYIWDLLSKILPVEHLSGDERKKHIDILQKIITQAPYRHESGFGILDDIKEIPAFSANLRNSISNKWGLKRFTIGNDVGKPNEHLWTSEITLAVMQNYFASHFIPRIKERLEPLFLTQDKNAQMEATTWEAGKVVLKTQSPFDRDAIEQALRGLYKDDSEKKAKALQDIYKPFEYRKSKVLQEYSTPTGVKVQIMPEDLVEVNTIKELGLDPQNFEDGIETREDVHEQSVEALLFHFGYLKKWDQPQSFKPLNPIIKNYHVLHDNIPLVHAFGDPSSFKTNFWDKLFQKKIFRYTVPENGELAERHTIHFSWGQLVEGHNLGNWEKYPYALIDLSQHFRGELIGTNRNDTMVLNFHKLSKQAILVAPQGFHQQLIGRNRDHVNTAFQIFEYDSQKTTLRDAIQSTIKKHYLKLKPSSEKPQDINQDHDGSVFDELEKIWPLRLQPTLSYEDAKKLVRALHGFEGLSSLLSSQHEDYIKQNLNLYHRVFDSKKVDLLNGQSMTFKDFFIVYPKVLEAAHFQADNLKSNKLDEEFSENKPLVQIIKKEVLEQLERKIYKEEKKTENKIDKNPQVKPLEQLKIKFTNRLAASNDLSKEGQKKSLEELWEGIKNVLLYKNNISDKDAQELIQSLVKP